MGYNLDGSLGTTYSFIRETDYYIPMIFLTLAYVAFFVSSLYMVHHITKQPTLQIMIQILLATSVARQALLIAYYSLDVAFAVAWANDLLFQLQLSIVLLMHWKVSRGLYALDESISIPTIHFFEQLSVAWVGFFAVPTVIAPWMAGYPIFWPIYRVILAVQYAAIFISLSLVLARFILVVWNLKVKMEDVTDGMDSYPNSPTVVELSTTTTEIAQISINSTINSTSQSSSARPNSNASGKTALKPSKDQMKTKKQEITLDFATGLQFSLFVLSLMIMDWVLYVCLIVFPNNYYGNLYTILCLVFRCFSILRVYGQLQQFHQFKSKSMLRLSMTALQLQK